MTDIVDFITDWRDRGTLKPDQARLLSDIESGRLFSLSAELRTLLYLGALAIVAGVGGTVKKYVLELGPLSITAALSLATAACYGYCLSRGRPYSAGKVESPTVAFDYVLYLGCAFLGILFGYLEAHYHLLADYWDYYLLASAALFAWLAYRFDNRLVLATALVNLGAWFGIRFSRFDLPLLGLRSRAILFGTSVIVAGWRLETARVKAHFADTYYNVGLHTLFWALLSGLFDEGRLSVYPVALALLTALSIAYAFQKRSFQYFLYGAAYGYVGLSYVIIKDWRGTGDVSVYFLLSSVALIAAIFAFRRRLEQDA